MRLLSANNTTSHRPQAAPLVPVPYALLALLSATLVTHAAQGVGWRPGGRSGRLRSVRGIGGAGAAPFFSGHRAGGVTDAVPRHHVVQGVHVPPRFMRPGWAAQQEKGSMATLLGAQYRPLLGATPPPQPRLPLPVERRARGHKRPRFQWAEAEGPASVDCWYGAECRLEVAHVRRNALPRPSRRRAPSKPPRPPRESPSTSWLGASWSRLLGPGLNG